MKYGIGIFLTLLSGFLLISTPAAAASEPGVNLLRFQQASPLLFPKLSLLPDFSTNKILAVGEIEIATCPNFDWVSEGVKVEYVPTVEETGICRFTIPEFGAIGQDPNGFYWLILPKFNLQPDDILEFAVVGADVLAEQMAEPKAKPIDIIPVRWEISDLSKAIRIPINPWHLETSLWITPLLTRQLVCEVGGGILLSGAVTIDEIKDSRSYYAFTTRTTSNLPDLPTPTELMVTYLDFPSRHPRDNFPGFAGLASEKPKRVWLKTEIVSGQAPNIDKSGRFNFTFVGTQFDRACRTHTTSLATEQSISLGTIRLGPRDVLTINLPDIQILTTSPPPSQRPESNILVYEGPAQFDLNITFRPTSNMIIKQIPFMIHATLVPIESFLDVNNSQPFVGEPLTSFLAENKLRHFAFYSILSLLFFMIAAVILRKFSQQLAWSTPIIWFGVGLLLLYWTPAVSSLLLLSLLIFSPHFKFRHYGQILVTLFIVTGVLLDNFLILKYPNTFGDKLQPVSIYTPYILLGILASSIAAIYFLRATIASNTPELKHSSYTYLPAVTLSLIIFATYEVINQSLIPLFIIITIVYVIQVYSCNKQQPTPSSVKASTTPPHEKTADKTTPAREQTHKIKNFDIPGYNFLFSVRRTEILVRLWKGAEPLLSAPPPIESQSETKLNKQPQNSWPAWLEGLESILKQPLIILGIIIIALIALSSVSNSLNGLAFTLLTLLATMLLFSVLYEVIPVKAGYLKALIFVLPLLLIFLLGIGTMSIVLPDDEPRGPSLNIILFLNQLEQLLIGRTIFYLSTPLFIGLYLEFHQQKKRGTEQNVQQYLNSTKSLLPLITAILSMLAPSLFELITKQPVIATFADIMERLLIISSG